MGHDLLDPPLDLEGGSRTLDTPIRLLEPTGSTTRSQLNSAMPSYQRLDQLQAGLESRDTTTPPGITADVAARMAAPRLTNLCEFEDTQLEAEYKRDEVRHELEIRSAHIAVANAIVALGSAAVNWAAGADNFVLPLFVLAYASCWLAYAVYARLAASRDVPLARIQNLFVVLFVCSHTTLIMLFGGLRETPSIGRSVIPMHQLFIVSLAAAYVQLDVRHCALIACAGMLGIAFNTALVLERDFPLLSPSKQGRIEITERMYNLAALAVLEAVMVFVSIRINTTLRTAYHFYRAVEADAFERKLATAEREWMLQHEAEVELKLRIAEAAKAARSSLIRMVMHDLRSP
eukprot:CAMPEP_0179924810 /NCGR_PEP_ID=MMETSP0983-20121128/6915_1 /TAXON_ID=483367 /ORGANISM="non described non described, Strain CCMP 2436" /LENGTH=346 /DNA_ID=CAMNT_0021828337 /DNA_START=1 /DNA_END=1037 /DNA_ORIENTATION=+